MCGMNESSCIVCCLQYFVEAGAMAVRRCKKADLKRIAKATGAAYLTSLSNMEGTYQSVLSLVQCSYCCGRCILKCFYAWHVAVTIMEGAYCSVL
jgi:chaperonin GroEL (HSP60 family)